MAGAEFDIFNVTRHPTADWVVQQLREPFPDGVRYRHAILDHDSKFDTDRIAFLKATGLEPTRISVQALWQNGTSERWVGSCRREILDHIIALNQQHLRRLNRDYVNYHHDDRCSAYNHFVSKQSNFWTLQDRVLSALDRWRVRQPHEFILRHAGNRLTMQTAAMERVPDSLVPPWLISARPMEPGTAARIHGIYNARDSAMSANRAETSTRARRFSRQTRTHGMLK